MTLRWYYIDPLGDLVEFTDRVQIPGPEVTWSAEQCSVASSSMLVENPLGDFPMGGHRLILMEEDSATFPRVWTGYSAPRKWSRGDFYRTGPSSVIEVSLVDANSIIGRVIITGSDGNRGAETDVARMQWLQSTYTWFIGDDAALSTANPVSMDASDYRGQTLLAVIQDCMDQSGKNAFNYDADGSHGVYGGGIFYDFASSTALSSTLRISNDMDDVDNATTWYASLDTDLVRDPSRVFGGVYGTYDGGFVYRTRPATTTAFALGGRDTTASWPNIKTNATAIARADRYLLAISTEEDIITTTIEVPAANVNDARAGFRIEARFTHLSPPDYDSFVWMRILDRTVKQLTPDRFAITYTLSPADVATPAGSCTTAVAGATAYDSGAISYGTHDWSAGPLTQAIALSPSSASVIVAILGAREASSSPSNFASCNAPYTMIGSGTGDLGGSGYLANVTSGDTFSINFTAGNANKQAVVAVAIETASAAPVQVAYQEGTGGTATLPNPPTPGNVLICASLLLGSAVSALGGWTTLAEDHSLPDIDSIHGIAVRIFARCVQEGDAAAIGVPNGARYHSSFVSEWAIT